MKNEATLPKALASAYQYLARRAHGQVELQRKLAKKGFAPRIIEKVLAKVGEQGYLNDEEVSRRWASTLIENRGWGRGKITSFLLHRGIPREIITKVQQKVWQEFNEDDTARSVLKKHFAASKEPLSLGKRARFLESRGFPAEVIYRVIDDYRADSDDYVS